MCAEVHQTHGNRAQSFRSAVAQLQVDRHVQGRMQFACMLLQHSRCQVQQASTLRADQGALKGVGYLLPSYQKGKQ